MSPARGGAVPLDGEPLSVVAAYGLHLHEHLLLTLAGHPVGHLHRGLFRRRVAGTPDELTENLARARAETREITHRGRLKSFDALCKHLP